MRLVYDGKWDTTDEAVFLRHLGRWSLDNRLDKPNRLSLLKRYRDAMRLRENWGDMDPDAVRQAVEREIALEEQK